MRFPLACLLLPLALLVPRSTHAQAVDPLPSLLAPPVVSAAAAPMVAADTLRRGGASSGALAVAGVLGGGVGMFAGMFAGAALDGPPHEDCIDFCFGPGVVYGFLLGEALGISTAVHLANGRRGSLPLGALTSAGILAVGLVAGNDKPEILLLLPVAQIVGAITVERRTARRR